MEKKTKHSPTNENKENTTGTSGRIHKNHMHTHIVAYLIYRKIQHRIASA